MTNLDDMIGILMATVSRRSDLNDSGTENGGLLVLESLFTRINAFVRRRIPAKFRARIDVDDIVQEIARTILRTSLGTDRNLSNHDWERMIWTITRRQIRKQLSRVDSPEVASTCGQIENEVILNSVPVSESPPGLDDYERLQALLGSCSERQKRIVLLRIQGLSCTEIATRDGINEGSIRRQLVKVQEIFARLNHE